MFEIRRGVAKLSLPIRLDPAPDDHDSGVKTLYESASINGTLRRALVTIPIGPEVSHPAVLILGGIGCFWVDNAADPEDAYLRLARDLGYKGFVAMRLEKSGVGDSQGPPYMTVDLLNEMHSYEVASRALKSDGHVDSRRVYLFGHSIGSVIAPRIASEKSIAGVIVAEAVGRNWFEYELWNLRRQLELGGESPSRVDATLAAKEICTHRLLIEKEPEAEIERTQPGCRIHNAYPVAAAYMQQLAALNIAEPWEHFSVPLLVIYGTANFVTTVVDHRRIAGIVNSHHPGMAEMRLINGVGHHLDRAATQQQAYDLRVKQRAAGPYDEDLAKLS